MLEEADFLTNTLLHLCQGLLLLLLEKLPHAVTGNTRDDHGCLKRYSEKERENAVAVSAGRVKSLRYFNSNPHGESAVYRVLQYPFRISNVAALYRFFNL